MLLAAGDLDFEAVVGEIELEAETNPADEIAAQLGQLLEPAGDRRIGVRLQFPKRQRLHLGHHLVHADSLGERRVDIHRLAGDAPPLLFRRDVIERAHVVQAVGELDQKHPDVVG